MLLSLHAPVTPAVQQRAVPEVQFRVQTPDPAVMVQGKEASLGQGAVFQDPVGCVAGRVGEALLFCCDAVAPWQSQEVSCSSREKTVRITVAMNATRAPRHCPVGVLCAARAPLKRQNWLGSFIWSSKEQEPSPFRNKRMSINV